LTPSTIVSQKPLQQRDYNPHLQDIKAKMLLMFCRSTTALEHKKCLNLIN